MFNQTPFYASYINPPNIKKTDRQIAREKSREKEAELRRRIMAMKGHPCTGKSTLAWSLAQRHEYCSFVSLEDIRDCLVKVQESFPDQASSFKFAAECLDQLAYETVCRITSTELEMGFHVVIDCPLTHRYHLDWLLQFSNSKEAKLILIECKPKDEYRWQNWLDQTVEMDCTKSYHPSSWEDLQKLLETCDDYDDGDVPKLVVDTTGNVQLFNVHVGVIAIYSSQRVEHLDLQEWVSGGFKPFYKEITLEDEEIMEQTKKRDKHFIGHTHQLRLFEDDVEEDITCNGCLKSIISSKSDPAYHCDGCTLFLHKSCAESPGKLELLPQDPLPFLMPKAKQYSFPKTFSCSSKYAFSYQCLSCLFLTHVRCGILPSILQHPCHEHPLLFKISRMVVPEGYEFEYQCYACDQTGKHVSYTCFDCNINVHVNCSFLPRTSKHRNHQHPLSLSTFTQEGLDEEFYCDICETQGNPMNWVYYCKECNYAAHLHCATSKD